jgi:hypothetical protein
MNSTPRCHHCNDVIGVYEPMVLVGDGRPRCTSRADEPQITGNDECYHDRCYAHLHGQDSARD